MFRDSFLIWYFYPEDESGSDQRLIKLHMEVLEKYGIETIMKADITKVETGDKKVILLSDSFKMEEL